MFANFGLIASARRGRLCVAANVLMKSVSAKAVEERIAATDPETETGDEETDRGDEEAPE